jgi:RNA polymerase II-associated factor 1
MKSFSVNGSDPTKQEKFLAYMAPAPHEVPVHLWYISISMVGLENINLMGSIVVLQLARDLDDEDDVQYSWLREYHWEVCVLFLLFANVSII